MIYFLVAWVSGAAGILIGMFLFALFHEREQMKWWRRTQSPREDMPYHPRCRCVIRPIKLPKGEISEDNMDITRDIKNKLAPQKTGICSQ